VAVEVLHFLQSGQLTEAELHGLELLSALVEEAGVRFGVAAHDVEPAVAIDVPDTGLEGARKYCAADAKFIRYVRERQRALLLELTSQNDASRGSVLLHEQVEAAIVVEVEGADAPQPPAEFSALAFGFVFLPLGDDGFQSG